MSQPRPVGDDLTDKALFAGLEVAEPPAPSEQMAAAVELAIRTLMGANLKPVYGFDQADAIRLWSAKLSTFAPASVLGAANEWVTGGGEFPTLAEFATLVASFDRASKRPAPPKPEPGEECGECGEERGMVFVTNPLDGGIADRRPCSRCRPVQYDLWRAGHFGPTRENATCHCNHPLCPDTKRREKAAARG